MDALELLGELVEGHEVHPVGAGVAGDPANVVSAVAGDFHPVGFALFAGTHTMAGGGVLQVLGWTEAPAGGFGGGGGHHRHRAVLVGVAAELAADPGKIAFQAAAAVAPPPAALQQMKRILHAAALMPPSFGIGDGSQRAAILRGGLVGRAWRLFTIIWVRSK